MPTRSASHLTSLSRSPLTSITRCIAKPHYGFRAAIDDDHALEPAGRLRKRCSSRRIGGGELAAARDRDVADDARAVAADLAGKSPSGLLRDLLHLGPRERLRVGRLDDRLRERMLRVAFEGGRDREHAVSLHPTDRHHFRELRAAVGERAGLVEDRRATGVEPLEHCGITDHDPPLRRERHGADDRDGDRDQKRTGRRDHEHGKEADGIAARPPRGRRDQHRQRRVERAERVAEPPQVRPLLLARREDVHDL
jgi:hypothetical protein